MGAKKTFIFYDEFLDAIEHMTPDECKQFMLSIRAFRMGNEIPRFEDRYMQDKLDKALELLRKDGNHWDETCRKRSEAATKMWENRRNDANASNCMLNNETETESKTETKTENEKKVEVTPKKKTYKPFSPDLSFIDSKFLQSLMTSWLDYKRDRKESYKNQRSVEECYKKLMTLAGNDASAAAEIVQQSMANNWAGLFELKKNNNNGTNINLTQYERRLASEQQLGRDLANQSAAEFATEQSGSGEESPFVPISL